MRAQKASKEQQLEMMDRQYKQLEGRLDEMLSRIARETEEIKDLEQQLTEGLYIGDMEEDSVSKRCDITIAVQRAVIARKVHLPTSTNEITLCWSEIVER